MDHDDRTLKAQTHAVRTAEGSQFEMQDCASTAATSFGWRLTADERGELAVQFKSDDRVLYVYEGVSLTTFKVLESAPSKGSFIVKSIKPKYSFHKEIIVEDKK